jgi:hypothetical protein
MGDLFFRGEGFYDWEGLKYLLFEYEQHLREQACMETPKLSWEDFNSSKKDYFTVEHIYPVTPKPGDWPSFDTHAPFEQKRLRNSLGNLLALSQRRNAKASNRPFNDKKKDLDGFQGYFSGSYSEIAVAEFEDWTPARVLTRGLDMVDFIEKRWSVSLGTNSEKIDFLGLSFLEPKEPVA